MNRPMLPQIELSLDVADPLLAHVVRFARDVAWRHRNFAADPGRFRTVPKLVHGTKSMTCANSVLPTFMPYPPER